MSNKGVTEIDSKIISASLKKSEPVKEEILNETVNRPQVLEGKTYKIKTPLQDEAIYITINDIVLNKGTPNEVRRPFEIFINSKNMESFQWMVSLTRIISAVFRKGGEVTFLIEELQSVWDPKGGYFKPGTNGVYMHSLVAEIGWVIKEHLVGLKMLKDTTIRSVEVGKEKDNPLLVEANKGKGKICPSCSVPALLASEGCLVCANCGYSKCG